MDHTNKSNNMNKLMEEYIEYCKEAIEKWEEALSFDQWTLSIKWE